MSKLLRDDWRDRKATSIPDNVAVEEWPEAVKGDDEAWLDPDFGLPPLHPSELDPLLDVNAPLVATWWVEHIQSERVRNTAELIGPHAPTWQYHCSIEAEVKRLASACRNSTGTERESNLRQLRHSESGLDEFRRTPAFHAAVAFMVDRAGAAIAAAGDNLTVEQLEARGRYAVIKAKLSAMLAEHAGDTAHPGPLLTVTADAVPAHGQAAPAATEPATPSTKREPSILSGVTKAVIIGAFPPPGGRTVEQWDKLLSDAKRTVWLKPARVDSGQRRVSALWNPAKLAMCICDRYNATPAERRKYGSIIERLFSDWLGEWKEYADPFE